MQLERRLARHLIHVHPERAAAVLERIGAAEAQRLLAGVGPEDAAGVLRRTSLHFSADALFALGPSRTSQILETLALDAAARLARRLEDGFREEVLRRLRTRTARALRTLLRFPDRTAGALMDPEVLALPQDLTAREALARVRSEPERARYNLYVVDREQRLVGVVNLRELFLAPTRSRLCDFMVREPARLPAQADRAALIRHPGWREVHALPVVDDEGVYLGAVRYRTLRDLEGELLSGVGTDADAPAALGELFAAGAAGLLDALVASPGSGKEA